MTTVNLSEAAFDSVTTRDGIVLVDFWANWCPPCRAFGPVFEKASGQHPDIVFAKVDTEAERGLAAAARITSIPTLMAFRDGICVYSEAGALRGPQLDELIQAVRDLDMAAVRAEVSAPGAAN